MNVKVGKHTLGTFVGDPLFRIHQKEKIPQKIAAKLASANEPIERPYAKGNVEFFARKDPMHPPELLVPNAYAPELRKNSLLISQSGFTNFSF